MANAICQDTTFKGKYILVEGNNDYVLFRKFFKSSDSQIQITHGKDNILEIYDLIKDRGFDNVIGIVDSDFNNLNGKHDTRESIFYTDAHDLELMLFNSRAIDSLIDTHCMADRLAALLEEENEEHLKDVLIKRCIYLGYLKWANNIHNWGLLFKPQEPDKPDLKIEDFIPKTTFKFISVETMVKTVFNYSRGKVKISVKEEDVVSTVKKMAQNAVDYHQLCNGHDIARVFALSLKKKTSNLNSNAILSDQIEREIVYAYDARYFSETRLYSKLKNFEQDKRISILNC